MDDAVRAQFDAFPDPSPASIPVGPGQLDRLDDDLHYGWGWHRYRYCFRRADRLRVLDAGCGTGVSTLGLARLNPGATVLGLDASARSLEVARRRAEAADLPGVTFRTHDLDEPLPGADGPFDFIACRRVLGQAADPAGLLRNLARALDHRGLLLATFPARAGRQPARRLRQAVEALAPPGATIAEKAAIGLDLFRSLRPDHAIRQFEALVSGPNLPGLDRMIHAYLGESERDFDLAEAIGILEAAGLQFLYAATRLPWSAGRVLAGEGTEDLRARVGGLAPGRLAALMAALDPALHGDEYRLFACPADFEPRLPSWPERRAADPAAFDRLIPHRTGLAAPVGTADPQGRPLYRAAGGALAHLDPRSDRLARAVDGRRSCGQIDRLLAEQDGVAEPPEAAQARWLEMTNRGLLLLESPDPRQHVDCRHLGPIRDRLDCPCPRHWIRACDRHEFCNLEPIEPSSASHDAFERSLRHLGKSQVVSCDRCPDYSADD